MIYSLGLTFYESAQWQSKNLDISKWGNNVPFVAKADYIPPFQLVVPTGSTITAEFNEVAIDLTLSGLRTESKPDHDVLIYSGLIPLGSGLTSGTFFLKINDGVSDYFSEEFCFADITNMVKITYKHSEDYSISTRSVDYLFPYTLNHENFFYAETSLVKPEYVYSTDVENRAGTILPKLHTVHKLHRFHFMGTEAILDSIMHIRLHDCIRVAHKDREYDIEDFLITPDFDDYAFFAGIDVEFKTSAMSVVAGRNYDSDRCIPEVQPVDVCVIDPLKGAYQSIDAAIADGVVAGDYFDLTLDNDHSQLPIVYQLDPSPAYINAAAGEAALGTDVCFPLGDGNDHGFFLSATNGSFAGAILIVPEDATTHDSDTTAQANNVLLNQTYFLRNSNYGQETFIRVLRSCSIVIVNVAPGSVNKFGTHDLTISIQYTGVTSVVFETQGDTRTVALDGSGSYTYSFTGLTPDGADHKLVAREAMNMCTSSTVYSSPLQTASPVAVNPEWVEVVSFSEPLQSNLDCSSGLKTSDMTVLFTGTTPILPSVDTTNTIEVKKYEYTDLAGRFYQMVITKDATDINVDFYFSSGSPSFVISDNVTSSLILTTPC